MTTKIVKGALVRLNIAKCFTAEQGGEREFPLGNYHTDEVGVVHASRPTSESEREAWREEKRAAISTATTQQEKFAIACDDAGESRLPPRRVTVEIHRDDLLIVERARCRVELGWGNATPGLTKVMLPNGKEAYLKRELIEVVV